MRPLTLSEPLTRVCRVCGVEKHLGEMLREAKSPQGRTTICRTCTRARSVARRAAARAEGKCSTCQTRPTVAGYTMCQPCRVSSARRSAAAPDANAASTRRHRTRKRERGICAYNGCHTPAAEGRTSCAPCAARAAARRARRASRARAALLTSIAEDRDLYGICYLCESPLGEDWHVEHVVALANGGPEDYTLAACAPCNRTKSDRWLADVLGDLHPESPDVAAMLASGVFTLVDIQTGEVLPH